MNIGRLLKKKTLSKEEIILLLSSAEPDAKTLFAHASAIREKYLGKKVHLRGLIEFSNQCIKNCFYCGIRKGNKKPDRYVMTDKEVLASAEFALKNGYGSVVLQAGENNGLEFDVRIEKLIRKIKQNSGNSLGITLSLGEQKEDTLQRWFLAGAHRYLLRIEASGKDLYQKIHPRDKTHDFETRINCLSVLKNIGYQCGTGVMIGLPFQTTENLAEDLLFFRESDIAMAGMGPYLEHPDTPLFQFRHLLAPPAQRLTLTFKMIAVLRLMMPEINIAATTALQAIDPLGREKALTKGANILMPNITPRIYKSKYQLYSHIDEHPEDCLQCLDTRIRMTGNAIAYQEWGDSVHFLKNKKNSLI